MTDSIETQVLETIAECRNELREIKEILEFFREKFVTSRPNPEATSISNAVLTTEGYKCPKCNSPMVSRKVRTTGEYFWGCTKYPECKGTRNKDGSTKPPF